MKKVFVLTIALFLLINLFGCAASPNSETVPSESTVADIVISVPTPEPESDTIAESASEPASPAEPESEEGNDAQTMQEDDSLNEDLAILSAVGNVEVVNGLLTVTVTLPAELVGDITQEQLDANGANYTDAKLNEDGSVSYKMTKAQYEARLSEIQQTIDDALQRLIDDDTYSISAIEHNENYSVFDVTMDGSTVPFLDMFTAVALYSYGGVYGIFSGSRNNNIIVNYLDSDGNLIESGSSNDMSN